MFATVQHYSTGVKTIAMPNAIKPLAATPTAPAARTV
jgi:hypothetical protein